MGFDNTVPDADNYGLDDIPAMQENFSLLESAQVVDEGSTADGHYIRYENGWQICVRIAEVDFTVGENFNDFDYPQTFANPIFVSWGIHSFSMNSDDKDVASDCFIRARSQWNFYVNTSSSSATTDASVVMTAIGRWK